MNTETILYTAIAWVFLIDLIFRIYNIRNTNKRILWLEANVRVGAKTSDSLSKRISKLDDHIRQQPPTDQPEVKDEPRTFVNVYEDDEGRYISDKDSSSYKEAYDGRDNIKAYLETVEIIRHKKS